MVIFGKVCLFCPGVAWSPLLVCVHTACSLVLVELSDSLLGMSVRAMPFGSKSRLTCKLPLLQPAAGLQ